MADLKSPKLIFAKGFLFLLIGIAASALVLIEAQSLRVGVLLALAIWAFCRFYYFAFYVIQHYVDPTYRFSGLVAFALYCLRSRKFANSPTRVRAPPAKTH